VAPWATGIRHSTHGASSIRSNPHLGLGHYSGPVNKLTGPLPIQVQGHGPLAHEGNLKVVLSTKVHFWTGFTTNYTRTMSFLHVLPKI